MTAVAAFTIGGAVEPWETIGLDVRRGVATVGGVELRFDPSAARGIAAWTLRDCASAVDRIDGLVTKHVSGDPTSVVGEHPLGANGFDHVVVMTSSLERTCGAIESVTGEPLKRVREAGEVRQGFHRLGPVIVEVVESARVDGDEARFWGLVLVVDDIHDAAGRLGPDVISYPKTAVQPGRLIASFREQAGLGLPVAIMSR